MNETLKDFLRNISIETKQIIGYTGIYLYTVGGQHRDTYFDNIRFQKIAVMIVMGYRKYAIIFIYHNFENEKEYFVLKRIYDGYRVSEPHLFYYKLTDINQALIDNEL